MEKCNVCEKGFKSISSHMNWCIKRYNRNGFYFRAVDGNKSHLWIYLHLPLSSTFQDLDRFIRRTWCHCCKSHSSSFCFTRRIEKAKPVVKVWFSEESESIYGELKLEGESISPPLEDLFVKMSDSQFDDDERSLSSVDTLLTGHTEGDEEPGVSQEMKFSSRSRIYDLQLKPKEAFTYEYDTQLEIELDFDSVEMTMSNMTVIKVQLLKTVTDGIEGDLPASVLARNCPLVANCQECGDRKAKYGCQTCDEDYFICRECKVKHGQVHHSEMEEWHYWLIGNTPRSFVDCRRKLVKAGGEPANPST